MIVWTFQGSTVKQTELCGAVVSNSTNFCNLYLDLMPSTMATFAAWCKQRADKPGAAACIIGASAHDVYVCCVNICTCKLLVQLLSIQKYHGLTSRLNQDLRLHTSSARPNLQVIEIEKLQLSV